MKLPFIFPIMLLISTLQAQTLVFTDHEPLGNMRTHVTERFFTPSNVAR